MPNHFRIQSFDDKEITKSSNEKTLRFGSVWLENKTTSNRVRLVVRSLGRSLGEMIETIKKRVLNTARHK